MERRMDWFESAREFERATSDSLSPTVFMELELQEFPSSLHLPENIEVQPLEIPGVHRVQDGYRGESKLSYFMDGVQRTVLWKHYDFNGFKVPIFLHFSGAVIMHRRHCDKFAPLKALYRNKILVPSFLYEAWGDIEGLADTGADKCWDLNEIRSKAMIKSRALRQEIEHDLMHRFIAEQPRGDVLIKDGNIFGSMKTEQVVGVIKTHATIYLQEAYPEIQQMVWSMPEYYRSMVFSMQLREGTPRYKVNSFYLRIHAPHYPEMGLLRVEYTGPTISADKFSSWLIAEKCIRANCSRWDRQIYPIQICEDYLRTQIPSIRHLKATLRAI
ncbi:MAG: hypothetical protein V3T58_01705 [Candidatus Hydrothermarchaeales archaeon]